MSKRIEKIEDLTPDLRNANKGTERGQYMIEHSLSQYGAGRSIVADAEGRVIAGNKTLQAASDLKIPVKVVETDGTELVVVQRTDLDLASDDQRARKMAYADNRSSEVGLEWDAKEIAIDIGEGIDLGDMFQDWELESITSELLSQPENDTSENNQSEGGLLSLLDITISEPRHIVENGDIWNVGHHILICCDVLTEWHKWKDYLKGDVIFAPYCGPFVPLSLKANDRTLVMVQPDVYIAGHILDRYTDVNGENSVNKNGG